MLLKKAIPAVAMIAAGLIAGCGGGGTAPATGTTAVSGKVADGYLFGATVFLDKNGNYQLDAGEPSTTTDANGNYTLNVDPADVGKYPIVALVIKGQTIDKDTGMSVTGSYVLSMPATATSGTVGSNFISPMSSELREMMETGKYASMQQAMNALVAKLGMTAGTNMLEDYMLANNATIHTAAQNIASLMGGEMAQVMGTSGATITVNVNRYRSMMGTIFSNMSSIKGSNSMAAMTTLMGTMTTTLGSMPMTSAGQPYQNMSSAFKGGMMGGTAGTSMGSGMMN